MKVPGFQHVACREETDRCSASYVGTRLTSLPTYGLNNSSWVQLLRKDSNLIKIVCSLQEGE